MKQIKIKTCGGRRAHPSITADRIEDLARACMGGDSMIGACVACGSTAYGVEPDARRYACESCGARAVYGGEELLLMTAT